MLTFYSCREWRAFTDEEDARLQKAKRRIREDKEVAVKAGNAEDTEIVEGEGGAKRAAEGEGAYTVLLLTLRTTT